MTPLDVHRTEGEPHNRVTLLADIAATAAQDSPNWRDGDRVIVLISDGEQGGATWQGYEGDDVQAIVDTIEHLRAMALAHGIALQVHPIPGRG